MKWSNFYREMTDRNIGVISLEEQEKLRRSCVAVAGCGGMGGFSAAQLVRLGVGRIKIADFDSFKTHNLSRQCASTTANVGRHKAQVLGDYFREINPELRLEVLPEGVQLENAEKFVDGAEVVIDGIDYTCPYNSIVLHRAARKRNLCILVPNAIGFGTNVVVFGPKTVSFEEYIGISPGASREEIENFTIPAEKFSPHVPTYADPEVVRKVAFGEINIPNIVMPQYLGTSIAISEAVMMFLGRVKPPEGPEPRMFIVDLQDRKFEIRG